ncbi:uncharacterized protein B0H18DRAFT_1123619 [Fomitopsis serialis]|uniref:uncharacterized protein n=1 Tax=Fomitopsis serialis TaxID=139415 RepID=UPI0020086E38|nr:uncharacterized protein B0H18DRAFT_1123619 [Neoantrodia serialis]KAH9917433.1 hypothetical protein B0H18DRAFT_1123619 [Neoantrodia serialis]
MSPIRVLSGLTVVRNPEKTKPKALLSAERELDSPFWTAPPLATLQITLLTQFASRRLEVAHA